MEPGFTPTPFGFGQASQAGLRKAPFPFDDYRARHADFVGGFHLAEAIGTVKDNPRTPVLTITGGGAIDGGASVLTLVGCDGQWVGWSFHARLLPRLRLMASHLTDHTTVP